MAAKKLNLPEKYLKWLAGVDEEAYAEFDDREWALASREELLETINVDDAEAPYLEQAKLYLNTIAEVTGESSTVDDEGNEIAFSRIKTWLTIGSDNEDLLCVDPGDKYSVWGFFPSEGGDVERLADSLDDFMEEVELTE